MIRAGLFFALFFLLSPPSPSRAEDPPARPSALPAPSPLSSAAAIAASLDDRLLAAQLIMTGIDGRAKLGGEMRRILEECPPGGIMLFKYNLDTPKEEVRSLLAECKALGLRRAGIPPFIAADHEGGPVHRFGPGVGRLPSAASWEKLAGSLGREAALAALEEASFRSGREIRELGLNMNFAPVAETLNDDNFRFLGERAFSADPEFTAAAAAAFVRGMSRAGIGCVAKHFPGNTGADPHSESPTLEGSREELSRAAAPFAALIGSGPSGGAAASGGRPDHPVSGLMVSHVLVPAWDGERIGSLSPALIGEWLRKGMGFEGIVLADDFSMSAAASRLSPEEAAVASIAAGADMVMAWPMNLLKLRDAILKALEEGRLSRRRLEEAAARIIAEKIRLGLIPPGRQAD
ncbi:MAG: glycoside hydrolase family 3 protein [Treponema sp.]|jgi:beta-N-acetylhexosaminidase|nr:glycoside hydrolase family 3 protein [Treponema sp.]